jgi:ribonuclease PH
MKRTDARSNSQLRKCAILPGFMSTALGSCLISMGNTRVICTASADEGVPPFLRGKNQGWLTAEYAMLPASTGQRKSRDGLKRDGRGVEISRLIGRSLRQALDLNMLGEYTITIDCDVLEADGGTRTAAITGGFVALCLAIDKMMQAGRLAQSPIKNQVAAVSCGLVGDHALLDLCYEEDSQALADMNFVMNEQLGLIEVQGTGEGAAFPASALTQLLQLARIGIRELLSVQRDALKGLVNNALPLQTLVLASTNPHKIAELQQMLAGCYKVIGMRDAGFTDEISETGNTFEENAILKAEAVCDATGCLSLADDSGLEVDVLGGAPGVNSARYAGQHGDDAANNALLLHNMMHQKNRTARFVSVLALAVPGDKTSTYTGICEGVITHVPRGQGGFGYDPLFETATGKTFAEMNNVEKNSISHRARAMAKLLEALR